MENLTSTLCATIPIRRSHRNYQNRPLDDSHRQLLSEFITALRVPFPHDIEITLHTVPEGKNAVYFKDPREFAAFKTSPSLLNQAKEGFIGELFILYCESLGVHTCWMGHYNVKTVHEIIFIQSPPYPEQPIVYCITPLGYASQKSSLINSMSNRIFSRKTKQIEAFLSVASLRTFPDFIQEALHLAGYAPSAMNSQKWTYSVQETSTSYTIELSKPPRFQHLKWKYYDIDVGTAAAHIWLGLLHRHKIPILTLTETTDRIIWWFEILK